MVALRDKPRSAETWEKIVDDHPEFFRKNGTKDYFALKIRSYFPITEEVENSSDKRRRALDVPETRELISIAIDLHSKEIERLQKNSHRTPIIVARIAFATAILTALFSLSGVVYTSRQVHRENSNIKQNIDSVKILLRKVESQSGLIKLLIKHKDALPNKDFVKP